MKKNMLILLALLMTFSSIFAMDIEIGTGETTTTYVPMNGLWDYSWSNFIIDANLIGMAVEINQIQFNVSSEPASYESLTQKVYFKHTTDAEAAVAYPNPETAGFTLVYDGDVTWNGSGWQGVMLDTPFEYNGTDNLQIVWENRDGSWISGYPNFYTTEVGTNVSTYAYADGDFPVDDGTNVTYFPNLKLSFAAENEPTVATLVAPENASANNATAVTLEWALGENTTDVDVYFSDVAAEVAAMDAGAMVVDGQNVTSYEATDLDNLTTYFWRVKSRNSANDLVVNGPVWSFTTEAGGGLVAVPIGNGTTSAYQYPWNFYYMNSLSETIYLASELNIGGQLQGLTFYSTFASDLTAKPVNIWIGETTQTDLSTYIPASQLTAVFAGTVDFPAGQNSINITLDTPYNYAGGNLVVLTEREMDTEYFSSSDKFFNTATELPARTMYWQSDSVDLDPETATAGTNIANMPNVTFYFITEGMGSVTGNVTDGTTGLAGVNLVIDGTNYQTMTTADGSFEFPYVAEADDYTLTASLHGYYDGTATFDVTEDEETMVDVTMTMLPNVEVTGQVITNDTGLGIQAHVMLTGYEAYEADTDANGYFTIAGVFANQTYAGTATAEGYQPGAFSAEVLDVDLDLGTILVTETLFPASNVVAALDGDDAVVTWNAPGSGGAGMDSFSDDFEGDLSNWYEVIEGQGTPGEGGTPSWYVGAPDQAYDGNCLRADWGYTIDTWAITPAIAVNSDTNINFDMSTSYNWFVDPNDNGDLSIKISNDGSTWTEIWTEDDYGTFADFAWLNISIPLSDYAGQSLHVALNLIGDDNANIHVDNLVIGSSRNNSNYVIATPNVALDSSAKTTANNNLTYSFNNVRNSSRAFEAYNLYRFLIEDEATMANWTLVEEEMTDTTYTDTDWSTLPVGFYKYAVRAVYTNGAEANASLSNWLQNSVMAQVTVNVDSNLGGPIADANIALIAQEPNPNGEYAQFTAMTDATGTAVITVNADMYDITISATGFTGYTDVVDATADVTVDVTLNEVALPPTAVVAEQVEADAVITWNVPGGGGAGEWITKGAEENNDGIGTGGAGTFNFAHMYTEAELADYQGMYINTIKIFPREAAATYTLQVFGGADGNTELYSQPITEFVNEAWNEYALDSSVAIPSAGPVYIGYYANTTAGYPGGCDAGPAVPGGDMVKLNDQANWDALGDVADIDINWNIQAYVSWSRGNQVAPEGRRVMARSNSNATETAQLVRGNLEPVVNPTAIATRELMGYKVWRFLSTDQGNEANWTSLTADMITDLTLTDTSWDALDSGSYKFAVKAVYTNDNMSPAAFSNVLLKDMYGTVDGMVMSAGAPINGASVTLDGNMTNTDASGYFIFTDILAGDYAITASAAGYATSTQNITVVGTQLTTVDFDLATTNILIEDSFETYADFSLEAGPWVLVDGDLNPTWGISNTTFANAEAPMAYIVFNPSMTTPPLTTGYDPYNGSKFMACIASNATPVMANNDWLMTQAFTLGDSGTFNFFAKSVVDTYGLERFNVLVSDGSTNPNDFTSISGATYTEASIDWTEYTYSLNNYANQTIRVAIQCVSEDAFMFMVDDVAIDAPGGTDNETNDIAVVSQLKGNYPNPFNPETTIAFSTKENGPVSIDIYNIKGQKVRSLLNENREAGPHNVVWNGTDDNGKNVASGVFFYRMKSGKYSSTKKMILMK